MNRQLKYVIIDKIYPVIFFGGILHSAMLKLGGDITSAAFLKFYIDEHGKISVAVFGHSESLGISSKPADAEIIKAILKI